MRLSGQYRQQRRHPRVARAETRGIVRRGRSAAEMRFG